MTSALYQPVAVPAAANQPGTRSFEDLFFRPLILLAMFLEIAVFVEPAPVDAVLMLAIVLGLALGKLSFANIETVPAVSLAIFALANMVSMYDPADPVRGLVYALVTLYLVATWFFFVGTMTSYGVPFMRVLVRAYCAAGLVSAALGVGAYAGLIPYPDLLLMNGRARGLFKDCNVYGPYFVPMAMLAFLRFSDFAAGWREKAAAVLMFAAATLAALFSFSRACWINYGVAMAVLLTGQTLFSKDRGKFKRVVVGLGMLSAGALLIALLINSSGVSEMMAQRVNGGGLQDYDRVRFATQTLALETAAERPLGLGPGQAEVMFQYATHSLYVRILAENGLVALSALLVFIGATAWRAAQLARHAPDRWIREVNLVALACIAGHMVNSAVIDTVHWRHIWFILALPWASTLSHSRRFAQLRPAALMRASVGYAAAVPAFGLTQSSTALEE